MEKSPVYARYGHKRALSDCQRALSDCKGALSDCKRALSNCKRALGDCKRALSNCNRALSECKRALYSRDVKELQTCCIVYHQRIMPAHIWHTKRGRVLQYVAVHIHICIYTYIYICMYTNIYVCRHIHNINIFVYIQIYASTHLAYQKRQRYHAKKPCVCPVICVAVKEPSKTEPRYVQKSPVQQKRNSE